MKLYVPEIGDRIQLTADWTFTLYNETRNAGLWTAFDAERHPDQIRRAERIQEKFEVAVNFARNNLDPGEIAYVTREDDPIYPNKLWGIWQRNDDVARRFNKLVSEWNEAQGLDEIPVTLVAGTVLKTDRIYIRKGLSEWSSITFCVNSSPDPRFKKNRKNRFWAKLEDCNKIEFDFVPADVV